MNRPETLEQALDAAGIESLMPWQNEVVTTLSQEQVPEMMRACIYHPTGKGKTYSSLLGMWAMGVTEILIIAPPATQKDWSQQAAALGFDVQVMSHAKFREKETKLNKTRAIICDEFHLLGGRKGQGWLKMKRLARSLNAPLLILSATPSYNAAERVYCVWHILDPSATAGGFEKFLLDHCELEPSFRGLPTVVGFRNHAGAEDFLSSLPGVFHEPDSAQYTIEDKFINVPMPDEWERFGYDSRKQLILASIIERKISYQRYQLLQLGRYGLELRPRVAAWLSAMIHQAEGHVLVYCDHSTIAEAAALTIEQMVAAHGHSFTGTKVEVLTGSTSKKVKDNLVHWFRSAPRKSWGQKKVLIATATMATGTDGFDKVCDDLILLQDTQDDSLRRQLVGRILPRGKADASRKKRFSRLVVGTP